MSAHALERLDTRAAAPRRLRLVRSLRGDKAATLGVVYLVLLVFAALFGQALLPHNAVDIDIFHRLAPPAWMDGGTWSHPLGTDSLGRDVLARLCAGARLSLLIGVSVVLLSGTLGTMLGVLAGYKGGRWDAIIMRLADAQLAFPGLLLVLLIIAFVGPSVSVIIIVIAIYGWMIYARLARGMVLQLRPTPAVQAAEMMGCSTLRMLVRHILPALYAMLLTQAMLELARVMIAEASLSYLGLGVQPPSTSWGLMVAENQSQLSDAWWTVVAPGVCLTITVLALNLIANWLRLQTNPEFRLQRPPSRLRGRRKEPDVALASSAGSHLLEVGDLDVRYRTEQGDISAVSAVTLSIDPGEAVAVVGESGSGKSSLALSMLDLVVAPGRAEAGYVRWQGEEVGMGGLRARRGSRIAMVFQDPMTSLNPLVPVGRQVGEVLIKHRGMSRAEARARTVELFTLVGISSPERRLRQFPYQLSGGLRQRVMIATALATEPELLVADEPTTALDATIQAQILELVAELRERLGVALLLITHDLGVVARVADRIVVMYGGRIVEEGPARTIFKQPRHRYTQALLNAVPRVERSTSDLQVIPGHPPTGLEIPSGCPFIPRCGYATAECGEMPDDTYQGARRFACVHPVPEMESA